MGAETQIGLGYSQPKPGIETLPKATYLIYSVSPSEETEGCQRRWPIETKRLVKTAARLGRLVSLTYASKTFAP